MRINVYIDGFNLYYGSIKNTSNKWLDLSSLCHKIFPKHQINHIRYFTALVKATKNDPNKRQRQLAYIRALNTIPNLTIHYGHFLSHPKDMALEKPLPDGSKIVRVVKTEEKGSDVNLATFLLVDGYENDYELAVVISNDSDLAEPVRIVRDRLKLPVGVINLFEIRKPQAKSLKKLLRSIGASNLIK